MREAAEGGMRRARGLPHEWHQRAVARSIRRHCWTCGAAVSVGGLFWLASRGAAAQPAPGGPLEVDVRTAARHRTRRWPRSRRSLAAGPDLRTADARPNRRVISVREIDPEEQGKSAAARAAAAGRWRAVVYDYAPTADAGPGGPPRRHHARPGVRAELQPNPSPAEWIEARDALLRHPELGPRLRAGELIAYRPMPPVLTGGEGGRRRLVTVGLLPRLAGIDATHEIVGVDLTGGPAQRFAARAPNVAVAGLGPVCGAPPAAFQERPPGRASPAATP